jgi:ABC-type multidrug transport system ATPase subunit
MLVIKNLTKKIESKTILKDISFSINEGELVLLLGRNGEGKTTLIKCISGLSIYEKGEVNFFDKKTGTSLNDKDLLIPKLTVYEYLKFVCILNDIKENTVDVEIKSLLSYFSMLDDKNKLIYKLSKGGVSKLSLISTLIVNPEIIILDEPFSGMDILTIGNTINILNERRKKGNIILISTHNIEVLYNSCTSIAVLKNKSVIMISPNKSIEYIKQTLKE